MARSGEIGGPPPLINSGVGGMAQPLNREAVTTNKLPDSMSYAACCDVPCCKWDQAAHAG